MIDAQVELDVHGVNPRAPMIPQLLSEGRCHGRVLRNLRAILGRTPTRRDLGLRWWQDAKLDFLNDEVTAGWRRVAWLERLLERLHVIVMWWTKDIPWRVRAVMGPSGVAERFHWQDEDRRVLRFVKRMGGSVLYFRSETGGWQWPRVIVKYTQYGYLHRRMTLLEWLRGPR